MQHKNAHSTRWLWKIDKSSTEFDSIDGDFVVSQHSQLKVKCSVWIQCDVTWDGIAHFFSIFSTCKMVIGLSSAAYT